MRGRERLGEALDDLAQHLVYIFGDCVGVRLWWFEGVGGWACTLHLYPPTHPPLTDLQHRPHRRVPPGVPRKRHQEPRHERAEQWAVGHAVSVE